MVPSMPVNFVIHSHFSRTGLDAPDALLKRKVVSSIRADVFEGDCDWDLSKC